MMKARYRHRRIVSSDLSYNCTILLCILVLFSETSLVSGFASSKSKDKAKYRTAYACEGKTLEIECDEGSIIQPIRANYGRYSISICNEQGNLDWKVDCRSPHSYEVILERCENKKTCNVTVSSALFHDHCPGTYKYLEVQYECSSKLKHYLLDSSTGNKPRFIPGSMSSYDSNRTSDELTTKKSPMKTNHPPLIVPSTRSSSISLPTQAPPLTLPSRAPSFDQSYRRMPIGIVTNTTSSPLLPEVTRKFSPTKSSLSSMTTKLSPLTVKLSTMTTTTSTTTSSTIKSKLEAPARPFQATTITSATTTTVRMVTINHERSIDHSGFVLIAPGISCIISALIFMITLILLMISRIKGHRQTIHKHLCCQLTVVEVILCVMTLQTWTITSPIILTFIALLMHYLLQNKFGKLLQAKQTLILYVIAYLLPIITLGIIFLLNTSVVSISIDFIPSYSSSTSSSSSSSSLSHSHSIPKRWFNKELLSVKFMWLYLPVLVSIGASVFIVVSTIIYSRKSNNKHDYGLSGMNTGKEVHFVSAKKVYNWQSTMYILCIQSAFWTVLLLFISSPVNSFPLVCTFCLINLVNTLSVLYVAFFNSRTVRNNVRKSFIHCRWISMCLGRAQSDNIGPTALSAPISAPMNVCFYSLDPTHLMQPPSPLVKLTSSSSSASSARLVHMNSDRTSSQETLPIHQMNTYNTSTGRHISDVNPYAPPVPIYARHEYEDISNHVINSSTYGQSHYSLSPYYYHTAR